MFAVVEPGEMYEDLREECKRIVGGISEAEGVLFSSRLDNNLVGKLLGFVRKKAVLLYFCSQEEKLCEVLRGEQPEEDRMRRVDLETSIGECQGYLRFKQATTINSTSISKTYILFCLGTLLVCSRL